MQKDETHLTKRSGAHDSAAIEQQSLRHKGGERASRAATTRPRVSAAAARRRQTDAQRAADAQRQLDQRRAERAVARHALDESRQRCVVDDTIAAQTRRRRLRRRRVVADLDEQQHLRQQAGGERRRDDGREAKRERACGIEARPLDADAAALPALRERVDAGQHDALTRRLGDERQRRLARGERLEKEQRRRRGALRQRAEQRVDERRVGRRLVGVVARRRPEQARGGVKEGALRRATVAVPLVKQLGQPRHAAVGRVRAHDARQHGGEALRLAVAVPHALGDRVEQRARRRGRCAGAD